MLKPLLVRITPFRMSEGVIALLSPLYFHGSSILNAAIRNTLSQGKAVSFVIHQRISNTLEYRKMLLPYAPIAWAADGTCFFRLRSNVVLYSVTHLYDDV